MWAVFSPHMLFSGICCCAVVCLSWHQQQRKSTLGLRGLVLLVCLCHLGFWGFFWFFLLTAMKALLTQWSVGQSSWTHLLASDEKVVPPCFSISVCNFSFLFFTEAPFLVLLILFQRISEGEVIYFLFFFIFLLTRLPGDMSKVTHFLTELAHTPKHQLCCKRGNKKEGKGGQGRLFH